MVTIHAIWGRTLALGREGENMARQIIFDISEWRASYGDGTVSLIAQRHGDAEPYPCNITVDGDTITWPITAADTAHPDYGRCELRYTVGDVLVKSETWRTYTADSLGTPLPEPPEPQKVWVDKVLEAGQAAVDASAHSPQISDGGMWLVWNAETGTYTDTGVKASGEDIVRINLADYGLRIGDTGVSVPQELAGILRDALDNRKALYVYGTLSGGIEGTVLLGNMYEYDGMIIASGLGWLYTGSATPAWFALTVDSNNLIANVLMGAIEGEQGPSGENGADGYSPTIDVSREIDTTILTITDVNGTTTVEIPDGKDGAVSSVNGRTGDVTLTAGDVGAVSVPATASVGQTVVVKAVDADGKPTEWEAADMIGESNYELIEKIVVGYAITTSEPDDWADNWTAYYTNEGTMRDPDYVALSGDVAPAWESGKFFKFVDESSCVVRSNGPDGTPYKLRKMMIIVAGDNTLDGDGVYTYGYYFNGTGAKRQVYCNARKSTATKPSITEIATDANTKTWSRFTALAGDEIKRAYFASPDNRNWQTERYNGQPITEIRVGLSNQVPAGCEVYIYGVRS